MSLRGWLTKFDWVTHAWISLDFLLADEYNGFGG